MKRFLILVPLSLSLLLAGCGSSSAPVVSDIGTGNQVIEHKRLPRDYTVNLADKDPSLSFELYTGDVITLALKSPSPKTVVRVNQIFSPDGKADGPFLPTTVFTAAQAGLYEFTIGINQMASEEIYTGNVTVHFSVESSAVK